MSWAALLAIGGPQWAAIAGACGPKYAALMPKFTQSTELKISPETHLMVAGICNRLAREADYKAPVATWLIDEGYRQLNLFVKADMELHGYTDVDKYWRDMMPIHEV